MSVETPRPTHVPLGLYRHYGGGLYDVIDLAFDSTNGPGEGRWLVLYRSHTSGRLNVREVGQFTEAVAWPDSETRPRFMPASPDTAPAPAETVDHPPHYGGAHDPYEVIKVIEAWKLGFHLGNTVKYIGRAGKKGSLIEDLEKARWYLDRYISALKAGGHVE